MSVVAEEFVTDFDHIQLMDIDPTIRPVPADVYELRITKAEFKPFTNKNTGVEDKRLEFKLQIVNSGTYDGRTITASVFNDSFGQRTCRRLSDATGVAQEAGEPLSGWLVRLGEVQPTFKAPVTIEGEYNRVQFKSILPA